MYKELIKWAPDGLLRVSSTAIARGVLLGNLGRGVPACFPNPDPISDHKMSSSKPVFRPETPTKRFLN